MFDLLLIPVAALYLLLAGLLFVYGINFLYLTAVAIRRRRHDAEPAPPPDPALWPAVTVQLPLYNERYVAERLLRAAAALDYPAAQLQIQVLDDSTDETADLVARLVAELQGEGVPIVQRRRGSRAGFKAGALRDALEDATGTLIAIFDADFVPTPDFLRRTVPYFDAPRVGFVQARWDHLNARYSLLTHLQSMAIDAHFMVEQYARSQAGFLFNFNGTAGIWRRQAIEAAGGWTADTLTEDLDLSYRAFLAGWEARFVGDVAVPAELPVQISGFRRQQHRWARGSLECALKLAPRVWRAQLPLAVKLQASLHLSGYLVHLLLFGLSLIYPLVLLLSPSYPGLEMLFGVAYAFSVTAAAPILFFVTAQGLLRRRWWRELPRVFFIMVMGTGLMVNTARAALQIVLGRDEIFERTAKFGLQGAGGQWADKAYQLRLDGIVYVELLFIAINCATVFLGLRQGSWPIALYALLFAAGLSYVAGLSIWQAVAVQHRQRRATLVAEAVGD